MISKIAIALAAIAFVVFLFFSTINSSQQRVEVCMSYQGRSSCRIVSASSREAALQAGVSNACATLTSGMTDSMACQGTPPTSVKWLEK